MSQQPAREQAKKFKIPYAIWRLRTAFFLWSTNPAAAFACMIRPVGPYHGKSTGTLKSPTHLLVQGTTIYVTAGSDIWLSQLPTDSSNPTLDFTSIFSTTLGAVAGLAFDQASPPNSYVAIRTSNPPQILICDSQLQNPTTFTTCADSPEFVLYVPD